MKRIYIQQFRHSVQTTLLKKFQSTGILFVRFNRADNCENFIHCLKNEYIFSLNEPTPIVFTSFSNLPQISSIANFLIQGIIEHLPDA